MVHHPKNRHYIVTYTDGTKEELVVNKRGKLLKRKKR